MDHVHLDDAKENNQVTEAADDSLNTSVNESLQLFKPKILNAIEIIRDKKKKRPDIDTMRDHIMKTEASSADKTLIEILVKELIKQNILINKKTTQGLDSFKILKNVDQTSQASPDQTLPDPPQIVNATKTPDTKGKDTSPDSPLLLNNILTPDTKIKQTTSFSNSFQESFFSLKAELFELKISLKNEIGELRNSIRDIKAKKDVHSEKANENKRLWDELENKNTIIKSLIDNFKQLADSISKSNTSVPLLQTPDFPENSNFILPKKYAHRETYDKSKPTNILSPNRYQLLEPPSENFEFVSENFQNTDALRLPGNDKELRRNRNVLNSQNTGSKRPSVVISKYPERQTDFSRPPVISGTKLFSEASQPSKGQRNILIFTDSIPKGIRIREFNSFIKNGKTKMVSFPGATSNEILHYLDVHLTNSSTDAVILHVGVNDLLEDNSQLKIENLGNNLRSMVEKCHSFGIKNVFISGLVYTTRIGLPVLERTHEMIWHLCNKLGICYVDNRNIRMKHLWKDGLHLVESGKVILANNFLSYLSKCFLIRTHHLGLFT